ncbi:MAG: hypothetical protein MMC23_005619 [Stictis urceolatum]|nr:hypothetical protein [Stictis urceolata]
MAGTFIGTVKHVSRPLPADKLEFGRVINEFESQYCRIDGNKTYANVDTLMAILVRGRLKDRRAHFEYYPNLQNLREIYQGRHFGNLIRSLPYEPIGKALLATAEGYIGMVNTSAEVGDLVYFLVGCVIPILLRRNLSGTLEVVGDCYIDQFDYEQALLGPFPEGSKVQMCHDLDDDPRLPSLPPEWKKQKPEGDEKLPYFRNMDTNEITKQDPRLSYDALIARGVKLETLYLT